MSIATELEKLELRRSQIVGAIQNKGVTIADNANLAQCVTGICNISSGGGSSFTGHVDAVGLRQIGWTEDDIEYFQKNVRWNEEDDNYHKVSDYNISLYTNATKVIVDGVEMASGSNFTAFKNDRRCVFFPKIDTSGLSSITFLKCSWIEAIPNISITSKVTNMYNMFHYCTSLISVDSSNWNTSSVTNMGNMFNYCYSLTSIDVSKWDTSKVNTMNYMFSSCCSLTSVDCSNWDTSKVRNISNMFNYCYSLISINCNGWNTSSVTDMSYMFGGCTSLMNVNCNRWNTSSVTNMCNMFSSCCSLTSVDCSNWDTSKVTNMNSMFSYCNSLTSIDCSGWNTSSVTNMGYICSNCHSLYQFICGEGFVYNSITSSNNFPFVSSNSIKKRFSTNFESLKNLLNTFKNSENQFESINVYFESDSIAYDDAVGTLAGLVADATANGYVIYNLTIQSA